MVKNDTEATRVPTLGGFIVSFRPSESDCRTNPGATGINPLILAYGSGEKEM